MKNINDDIKNGEFKQVYLLYGDEDYLKAQYRDKLTKAVAGDDTMNCTRFYRESELAKDAIPVKDIISNGDTMPFFAERRLIVIENSGMFTSSNDEMADYIKNLPDYLVIVFVEEKIDKRNKVYKAVNDKGYVSEMSAQPVSTLSKWIASLLKAEGKSITQEAVSCLLDKTGASMNLIKQETEKLLTYACDRPVIEKNDVEAVCATQTFGRIFDMIAAIGNKNEQTALNLYYDLLTLKESPMRILYLIVRQFNGILLTAEGLKVGKNTSQIAKESGNPPFVIGKYATQTKNFQPQTLKDALVDCAAAEQDVKTGRLTDRLAVEMIIIKYSRA